MHAKQGTVLSEHTKALKVGDTVSIQNQTGPNPNKWDKTGAVVERMMNDQYRIKTNGSGRITLRKRHFLRPFTPYTTNVLPLADEWQRSTPEERWVRSIGSSIKNTMLQHIDQISHLMYNQKSRIKNSQKFLIRHNLISKNYQKILVKRSLSSNDELRFLIKYSLTL